MTDAFTIKDAREVVLDLLNDPTGVRYAPPTDGETTPNYRRVDRALGSAGRSLLDEYVKRGGSRFDEQLTDVSTDEDDGTVEMATQNVVDVRDVRIADDDGSFVSVRGGDIGADYYPDQVERELQLTIVRHFPLANAKETDYLTGVVAGHARSWSTWDDLVCAMAADALGAKDKLTNDAIARAIKRGRSSIFGHVRLPASMPWPERRITELYLPGNLRWIWFENEQRLQLVYGRA